MDPDQLSRSQRDFDQHGFVVLRGLLEAELLTRAREWADSLLTEVPWSSDGFDGHRTRRVYGLLHRLGDLERLLTHPVLRELVSARLGPDHQFGMLFVTAVDPGQSAQMLHFDAGIYPLPRDQDVEVNAIWALDDFTDANGATVVAPGSHLWPSGRRPRADELVSVVMPAGSALLYSGRLWHGAGANTSGSTRRALVAEHLVPWLRPADNQALASGPDALRALSPHLRMLAGGAQISSYFGFVGGKDPAVWLNEQDRQGGSCSAVEEPTLLLITGPPGTGKSTLAEHAAETLSAPVIGWDWVMAGLTPYPAVEDALRQLSHVDRRGVGWSVMLSLATAQLRRGSSVILDGVARDVEIQLAQAVVDELPGVRLVVVVTSCADLQAHRARLERRRRDIPGWDELAWVDVERVLASWQPPTRADLHVDAMTVLETNCDLLSELLAQR